LSRSWISIYFWANREVHPRDNKAFHVGYQAETGEVSFSKDSLWEPSISDKYTHQGRCSGEVWLVACRALIAGKEESLTRRGLVSYMPMKPGDAIRCLKDVATGDDIEHVVLDSYSIIEKGETACRGKEVPEPTPSQAAILRCISEDPRGMERIASGDVEGLIADVLAEGDILEGGVQRYTTETEVELIGISARGSESAELVLLRVERTPQGIAVGAPDRFISFPEQEDSDRMLIVSSEHTMHKTACAYSAHRDRMDRATVQKLASALSDASDWQSTTGGLWTKG